MTEGLGGTVKETRAGRALAPFSEQPLTTTPTPTLRRARSMRLSQIPPVPTTTVRLGCVTCFRQSIVWLHILSRFALLFTRLFSWLAITCDAV